MAEAESGGVERHASRLRSRLETTVERGERHAATHGEFQIRGIVGGELVRAGESQDLCTDMLGIVLLVHDNRQIAEERDELQDVRLDCSSSSLIHEQCVCDLHRPQGRNDGRRVFHGVFDGFG